MSVCFHKPPPSLTSSIGPKHWRNRTDHVFIQKILLELYQFLILWCESVQRNTTNSKKLYSLERLSGAPSREVGQSVRVVWMRWVGLRRRRRRFLTQRAGARPRVHSRRHVQQAVKERRLLHHAHASRTRATCALSCHTWLTAKAYMSLRNPIHDMSMLEFFSSLCSCVFVWNSNGWTLVLDVWFVMFVMMNAASKL